MKLGNNWASDCVDDRFDAGPVVPEETHAATVQSCQSHSFLITNLMPFPDLPTELWLEILSYLPRTALHKMIGVNRPLFELALNDLYEEVRFISDDRHMLKTFNQLK